MFSTSRGSNQMTQDKDNHELSMQLPECSREDSSYYQNALLAICWYWLDFSFKTSNSSWKQILMIWLGALLIQHIKI